MKKFIDHLIKEVKKEYTFCNIFTGIIGLDKYYCTCGETLEKEPETAFELTVSYEEYLTMDFIDTSKLTKRVNLICPSCHKDYSKSENYSKIINLDQKFLEKFHLEENSKSITLYKCRFSATEKENNKLEINVDYSALSVSKKNKNTKLYFKDYEDNELKIIDLSDIIKTTDTFFSKIDQVEIIDNFIFVHEFIGKIARYVSDAENIDIVNQLLSEMKFGSNLEILKKIISTFFGIICYSNLSTLAMVKGPKFVYDLMNKCPLPSTKYMIESGATSPLRIFNYLINLKNEVLQKELDQDDKNKLGYKFINEAGREFLIKFDAQRLNQTGNVSKNATKVFVRDEISQRNISPFIFNKIQDFSDYENLIKYLRFISYEQLIELCMKYDKDFIINLYKLIEFREDVNYERINQFIYLIEDFCKTIDINKEENINPDDVLKYDFNIYDDCQRMLIELNWDFNKVFYKLKKHSKLLKFHDDLVKYRGYLNDKEINQKYIDFSNKFKYLEEYNKSNIKIKVIDTPQKLVEKAKIMKNCAASYVKRVALNEYVAFNVYDNSTERQPDEFYEYMMVLELGKYGLEFVGVKGPCNIYGSDRFKKQIINFLEDNDIAYKELPSIKLGLNNKK